MPIILSLLIFSIRIALSFGNAIEEALPTIQGEGQECIEFASDNDQISPIIFVEQGHSDAVIEENSEEESENDELPISYGKTFTHSFRILNKTEQSEGLNSNPKQGNLHLYDLFHSWKDYLS